MNVVFIPRRFVVTDWGGTETVILETGKCLKDRGHQVEILCPDALSHPGREVVGGIPVSRYPYFYPYFGLGKAAQRQLDRKGGNLFSLALMSALQSYPDLDLIHLHTGKRLGGIGRTVAQTRRIPYVITLHGGVHEVPAEEASTWTEPTRGTLEWGKALGFLVGSRQVLRDAAAIICVDPRESVTTGGKFPGKRVVHIPNGVDPDRFAQGDGPGFRKRYGIPGDAHLVLTVGRIDPQKNQRFAVRLLGQVLGDDPAAHLLLVGPVTSESYAERLREDIESAGLGRRVTLIEGLNAGSGDLVDAYHAADVFLLPSIHEPFGIVILEAWSAGLPVIASRVGGVPSFLEDGQDGLLFEPGDLDGCQRALRSVAGDGNLARSLGVAGRDKAVTRYSWDVVTRTLESLYEDVIRDNGRSH